MSETINNVSTPEVENTAASAEAKAPEAKKPARKRRLGDRKDGYRIRTLPGMNKIMPYIMPQRCDACNTFADATELSPSGV